MAKNGHQKFWMEKYRNLEIFGGKNAKNVKKL